MKIDFGILAGGDGKRLNAGIPKAWVTIGGQSILSRVYYEIPPLANKIFVVGHDDRRVDILGLGEKSVWVQKTGKYISDLFAIVNSSDADLLIVINADAVLVTEENLDHLVWVLGSFPDCGVVWPAVPIDECFPEAGGRRYIPGSKSLARGNVFAFRPKMVRMHEKIIKRMEENPTFGEVIALGLGLCLRYATRSLKPHHVAERLGLLFGCKAFIAQMSTPEFAFDVDHPKDRVTALEILRKQGRIK
ncbi:MAG: NTP transferase domain-containing protein [Patescibacteria group bacterium]|jgi:hypothetical protein